ncbi:MAG: hypothetical protein O3C35_05075 [Proteobacteria bacterium]|nr:hypothetical protein [Pseudomonadota bacterium]
MDNKMIDFFVNNVEVKRYHDEEGYPRVMRTSSVSDEDDLFIHFLKNYSDRKREDFYRTVDEIKAKKLGMTVLQLRISEYVDKDGMYFDETNKNWKRIEEGSDK